VQPPSWCIHIRRPSGVVQRKELISKPTSVLGLNAALRSRPKEPLDTFVPEALYHLYSVKLQDTEIKSFPIFVNTSKQKPSALANGLKFVELRSTGRAWTPSLHDRC
jgi:hypothetical protein